MNIPQQQLFSSNQIRIGTRVIVHDMAQPAYVSGIGHDEDDNELIFYLDWGSFGKSRVRAHDFGSVWRLYSSIQTEDGEQPHQFNS